MSCGMYFEHRCLKIGNKISVPPLPLFVVDRMKLGARGPISLVPSRQLLVRDPVAVFTPRTSRSADGHGDAGDVLVWVKRGGGAEKTSGIYYITAVG